MEPQCTEPPRTFVGTDLDDFPSEVLAEYPGLDILLATIGETVRSSCWQPNGPTHDDLKLMRLPDPSQLAEQADRSRAVDAVDAFYRDDHAEGCPDSVALVPILLRELSMLHALSTPSTSRILALPSEAILADFAHDLYQWAMTLSSMSPGDARTAAARHSTAAETVMRIGRWIGWEPVQPDESATAENTETAPG